MSPRINKSMSTWSKDVEVTILPEPKARWISKPVYRTPHGAMYCGDSARVLRTEPLSKSLAQAQLIFTSPPFPLNTKKRYGNLQGEDYIDWFASFARLLKKFLTPDGSIVVEIGNAWEPRRPIMSTVVLRALLRFLERGGFKLCQEFIWYNPARLPSPIQWVNIERIRVKDAFTRIWWMSCTDRPKADNRRVLREYSQSMKDLLSTGKYNSGPRPSQYVIGKESFKKNNSGAIPPNVIDGDNAVAIRQLMNEQIEDERAQRLTALLKGTNTRSNEAYQNFCRTYGIDLHPARMPDDLVEFFVRFLTDKGDLVLDPFGGSNTTGAVAENMERRWISIEANWAYATSSIGRFAPEQIGSTCKQISLFRSGHAAVSASSVRTPVLTS